MLKQNTNFDKLGSNSDEQSTTEAVDEHSNDDGERTQQQQRID